MQSYLLSDLSHKLSSFSSSSLWISELGIWSSVLLSPPTTPSRWQLRMMRRPLSPGHLLVFLWRGSPRRYGVSTGAAGQDGQAFGKQTRGEGGAAASRPLTLTVCPLAACQSSQQAEQWSPNTLYFVALRSPLPSSPAKRPPVNISACFFCASSREHSPCLAPRQASPLVNVHTVESLLFAFPPPQEEDSEPEHEMKAAVGSKRGGSKLAN